MKQGFIFFLFMVYFHSSFGYGQTWDHIIENIDTTGTINLTDASWNNTLIKNCTIHNTGAGNDGIFLRDVQNVRIENCIIYNIDGQGGIRFSISGSGTDSVHIINNTLYNLQQNGINAPQRSQNGIPLNQKNLVIEGNTIYNSGLGSSSGLHHAIYCQAADFVIKNNILFGIRDGNVISIRSSGLVSGNIVSGKSNSDKPAIRYFSDHYTGNSDTLLIENNILYNDSSNAHTLDIFDFANLYQNSSGNNHVVKNINLRYNTIVSFHANKFAVNVSDDFNQSGFSVQTEGNLLANTNGISQCVLLPSGASQTFNLLMDNLNNFSSNIAPYDFHITNTHSAFDYVGVVSTNFPAIDIDGETRNANSLDAGADEYFATTGIAFLNKSTELKIFPNPIAYGKPLTIESTTDIYTIKIISSNGQKVFEKKYNTTSKTRTIDLPVDLKGICYILINESTTLPLLFNNK